MEKIKLINHSKDLERGMIIRCKGECPYEEVVDFLICETPEPDFGYTLMVISGYKAGLKLVTLPKDSLPNENSGYAINVNWLKNNWHKWGYNDCLLEDVWIITNSVPKL
ncbi:MAG: Imm45 family immunity protein [Spirochaetes bacterium]|nr:Imm45 family immunity protein [Spirochaetota bacterium]